MEWEGGKQHNYALVTICFRDGDMEHYDQVIYSKDTFVNNDHIQLLQMMYGGVSNDPVDYSSQGGGPYEEYWHDGMNAVSIYDVKYLTANEYEVLSKFDVATFLGAESEEKKDWMGISLAGTVDEIFEMLSAEEARKSRRYVAETNEGNFSGTMEPHITYEVSFSSSLPMDEDYYYDDQIIQDYVEELIRDEDESRGIQAFDFVMDSGWYSGAHIDGTVTWWTGNYSAESLKRWDSDVLILRDYLNTGYIGYLWQFKNRFGTDDPDEIRRLVKEKDDLERVPRWNSMKIGPKTLKKVNNRKTPLPVDFNWDSQFKNAETFEATSYGNYYGACLLPDGSCTETSLDMCRAVGGRFQGPGTSCSPDAGWARPRVMQAENVSTGLGKGFTIGVIAGIVSGLVTTVFGTVLSEILLDRLREDPELEITEEDPGTNTPHM